MSLSIALVITDFPEPLSPTMNKISPLKTSRFASSTAYCLSAFLGNAIVRFCIFNIFSFNLINPLKIVPSNHQQVSLSQVQMKLMQALQEEQ